MNAPNTFEPYLETRPEAFTVAMGDMTTAAPPADSTPRRSCGNLRIELPELGGSSFTDTNPWARGGLNE